MSADYCSVRDVRLALTPSGLATDAETAAKLPDWQIVDAITEAEGIIDAHLKDRYQIIVADVEEDDPEHEGDTFVQSAAPTPVRAWTRDIAAFLSALTYRKNKDLAEDDPIRLRFNMVSGYLIAVRDGKMSLGLPSAPDVGGSGAEGYNLYDGKLFGPEDFGLGYGPDTRQVRVDRYRIDV